MHVWFVRYWPGPALTEDKNNRQKVMNDSVKTLITKMCRLIESEHYVTLNSLPTFLPLLNSLFLIRAMRRKKNIHLGILKLFMIPDQ